MMSKLKVVNFGSINIDHVYKVHDFVTPGQTISCLAYEIHAGGKGLNQSVALRRAGLDTYHVGKIAASDLWLKELLEKNEIHTDYLSLTGSVTGHAIIQVNRLGENCIIIHGGANQELQINEIQEALGSIKANACLIQNETNYISEIITQASSKNIPVFFNPAPYTSSVSGYPLNKVECLILNETEAFEFCRKNSVSEVLTELKTAYPHLKIVLTLGKEGAIFQDGSTIIEQASFPVEAVDSTAAGDTFIGFFMAEYLQSSDPGKALKIACQAAAVSVTKKGASDSVPTPAEVQAYCNQ